MKQLQMSMPVEPTDYHSIIRFTRSGGALVYAAILYPNGEWFIAGLLDSYSWTKLLHEFIEPANWSTIMLME